MQVICGVSNQINFPKPCRAADTLQQSAGGCAIANLAVAGPKAEPAMD